MIKYRSSIQAKFLICFALIFFPTLAILFLWEGSHQEKQVIEQVKLQAEALCRQIILTRQWVADCGGVMALRDSPGVGDANFFYDDRIETERGTLQRFTPSMVTKKLSDYSFREDLYRFRLVSLNPINPQNWPDDFEMKALNNFKTDGSAEMSQVVKLNNKNYYHYIVPLFADKACLQCHEYNNLSENSIRGGLSVVLPFDHLKFSISENRLRRAAIGAAILLLMTSTLFIMLRRVVIKPVAELQEMASQIREGNLGARVDIKAGDEFEKLGTAFNAMAQNLAQNREVLERKVNQATCDLSQANKELQTLDQLKNNFLANMSHELRSPLTVIRGGIDYLNRKITIEDNRNYLGIIDKNLNRLIRLVSDIFDFTKIEANKIEWSFERENMTHLIEDVMEIMSPLSMAKQIDIKFDHPGEMRVDLDLERIEQVLVNLLDNAIKFSEPRGRIMIRLSQGREMVTVSLRDEGVGISEVYLDEIFDKFSTVPRGSGGKTEGTGLGLAICKAIVEAHGGRIGARSVEGESSTFFFTLPRRQNGGVTTASL
jgi:signal transduction histidine kinase